MKKKLTLVLMPHGCLSFLPVYGVTVATPKSSNLIKGYY